MCSLGERIEEDLVGQRETMSAAVKKQTFSPKAIIHQKYGSAASYKIEEVQQLVDNGCPGLVIQQQMKYFYRCHLDLPELSVTSDAFARKNDAEQSAAKIAIEKLGIESKVSDPTPEEAWNELIARLGVIFKDEFLSSLHPLVGHFRVAFGTTREHFGMIPVSAIASCDAKVNVLCKIINFKADADPLLVSLIITTAASKSGCVCINGKETWLWKKAQYSPEIIESVKSVSRDSALTMHVTTQVVYIPCSIEENVKCITLDVPHNHYYMDRIAQKLNVRDSSQVLVSRTLGKASSEMKLYFPLPEAPGLPNLSFDSLASPEFSAKADSMLNQRASYLSGQNVYGDAILANIGYTWKSPSLFYEDVLLCAYYRMLISKEPNGHFKLCREALLAAELPAAYTGRSNWKGPSPKDLLSVFCHQHRLSEPTFSVKSLDSLESTSGLSKSQRKSDLSKSAEKYVIKGGATNINHKDLDKSSMFACEVKILSRKLEPIVECSLADTFRKESDAIQNAALKVLLWFSKYFEQLDMPMEKLPSFGHSHGVTVYLEKISREFSMCISAYRAQLNQSSKRCSSMGSLCKDPSNRKQDRSTVLLNIKGPDSGVYPTPGSLTCISYAVGLVRKGDNLKTQLEKIDEFEFELGTGAVINHLEACVAQLSINQVGSFIRDIPSYELILAANVESASNLSELSLYDCVLEYTIQLLRVTEPLEDRMEQALFNPPLSKQRVEFAVGYINQSHATGLVDFGCGSGSLLDSILEQDTTLEKIVGVDISCKSLARAAKILHQKLSMEQKTIKSARLYDGSITNFDFRLHGYDIGTCLEVIEHMEEDQACLFGDVVLSCFCPSILIVSTPNYEYNPILQRSAAANEEEYADDQLAPFKFRNHDHKFEWTRAQFQQWATDLASRHDYCVEFSGVGGAGNVEPGFASQIAVFKRLPQPAENKLLKVEEPSHPYELVWEWSKQS